MGKRIFFAAAMLCAAGVASVGMAQGVESATVEVSAAAPDSLEVLETVTVTGRLLVVTMSKGKTTVRVAGSQLANLPEVTDVLRRAPGLRVSEGGIEVAGKGTPQIFVDGRESSFEELVGLQPQQVVAIEVDTNPGARYAAEYSSVVKVRTNRATQGGVSGQAANHSYIRRRYSNSTSAQLQIARKQWVNYLSYSYTDQASRSYTHSTEAIHLEGRQIADSIYSDDLSRIRQHSLLYGSTLDLNERHQLSWQYSGTVRQATGSSRQQERIRQQGTLQLMEADDKTRNNRSSHSANVRWKFAVDSVRTLEMTTDWARSAPRSSERITQRWIESGETGSVAIANRSMADVLSAKAEWSSSLWGADLLLGARWGHINSRTTNSYNDKHSLTLLRNNNAAAYATLGREYTRWGWSTGVRGEASDDNIVVDGSVLRAGWRRNLFPSAEIYTRGLTRSFDLAVNYSSRIIRPTVHELNPAANYINSLVTGRGNPLLLNTVCHNFEMAATMWNDLVLTLGADFDINPSINAGVLTDDGRAIDFIYLNVPRSRTLFVKAAWNKSWGPASVMAEGVVQMPRTKIPYLGVQTRVGKPSWGVSINGDVKLGPATTLTAEFEYTGHSYYLMTAVEPYNYLEIGVTHYLLERRLQLSVTGSDLLRGSAPEWRDRYGFYETSQVSNYDSRMLRLSVRWMWGDFKARYRERERSEEFNRMN